MALQLSSPNFGLIQNIPAQMRPELYGQTMAQTAQAGLANAQAGKIQQDKQFAQLDKVNQLTGAVLMAPPDQQGNIYQASLEQAAKAGIDTTAFPKEWNDQAKALATSAYYNSGTALNWYKAQAEMGLKQAAMGLQFQGNQMQAAKSQAELNAQGFPIPGTINNVASMANPFLGSGAISSPAPQQALGIGTQYPGQAGVNQALGGISPQAQASNPYVAAMQPQIQAPFNKPNLEATRQSLLTTPTNIPPKAQLTGSEEGQKLWVKWGQNLAESNNDYSIQKQALQRAKGLVLQMSLAPNPIYGKALEYTPEGQALDIVGKQLNLNYMAQLSKSGMGRLNVGVTKAAQFLTPGTDKYRENSLLELERLELQNEKTRALAQLYSAAEVLGVKDPNKVVSVLNNAVEKSGAIDPSSGIYNTGKFANWKDYLPKEYQQALGYTKQDYRTPEGQDANKLIEEIATTPFQTMNGKQIPNPYYGLSRDEVAQAFNLAPKVQVEATGTPQQQQRVSMNMQNTQNAPRGIRNNNPGNIIQSKVQFGGEVPGKDSKFRTFESPEAGIKAMGTLIDRYKRDTVEGIVSKWAPPNENNTQAYIKKVAQNLGVSPTQKLNLENPMVKAALVYEIIRHENGNVPYDPKTILASL